MLLTKNAINKGGLIGLDL